MSVTITAISLAAALSAAPKLNFGQERAQVRALRDRHNAALAAHDIEGITGLATDDFVMILGGSGEPIRGPAAYRAYVAEHVCHAGALLFVRRPDRIDVGAPDGTLVAAEAGKWVGTASDGGAIRLAGRYLVNWTKRSGDWRIASETYIMVDCSGQAR